MDHTSQIFPKILSKIAWKYGNPKIHFEEFFQNYLKSYVGNWVMFPFGHRDMKNGKVIVLLFAIIPEKNNNNILWAHSFIIVYFSPQFFRTNGKSLTITNCNGGFARKTDQKHLRLHILWPPIFFLSWYIKH